MFISIQPVCVLCVHCLHNWHLSHNFFIRAFIVILEAAVKAKSTKNLIYVYYSLQKTFMAFTV